jgi:hypothetical protein
MTKNKERKNCTGLQIIGWKTLVSLATQRRVCVKFPQTQAILLYFTLGYVPVFVQRTNYYTIKCNIHKIFGVLKQST